MSEKKKLNLSPGVITGAVVQDVFAHAKANQYALPAVNVVNTSTVNAAMEAARDVRITSYNVCYTKLLRAVSNITIDKLRDSSDFLNLLFNNILSSVFVVTKDCRIVMVNSAFSNLLKKQEGEVLQGLCGDVIGCQHPIEERTFCGNTTNCGKCELRNGIQCQKELDT